VSPRLPLRELEEASADPTGYRAKLYGPPRQAQGSIYFNALRNTIFNFHKPQWTAAQAESYLEDRLANAANAARRAEAFDQFHWYLEQYRALRWATALTRLNPSISLPPSVTPDLTLSGQIARVDLVPSGGYAGWIFASGAASGWQQELRMPILQEALADEMNTTSDDVIVGIYAFQDRSVKHTSYSATEIREARASLESLLQRLRP
jgi:hypothetical protein